MKSKDTIRSIFRSRWVSGISDSISTKSIAICLLWCPIMLHPSYNYFTTERICAPLCQQVPYFTLSFAEVKIVVQSPTVFRCKKETQFALHTSSSPANFFFRTPESFCRYYTILPLFFPVFSMASELFCAVQ